LTGGARHSFPLYKIKKLEYRSRTVTRGREAGKLSQKIRRKEQSGRESSILGVFRQGGKVVNRSGKEKGQRRISIKPSLFTGIKKRNL